MIEVLAPRTHYADRGEKFSLYQKYGVREYWLVDPEEQYVEVFVLQHGKFIQEGLYLSGDDFTSHVLPKTVIEVAIFFES